MRIVSFLVFVCYCVFSNAQQTISTAGGEAAGAGGSVSYSVGQVVYTTNTGINGTVAQGVQQPFEISVVTGFEEADGITLQCSVYPNPAKDYLVLKVENYDIINLSYQLSNINGKILEQKKLEALETNIVMSNLVPATYFLKVINDKKEVKTFKIVKN
jgi:hypothetical protein